MLGQLGMSASMWFWLDTECLYWTKKIKEPTEVMKFKQLWMKVYQKIKDHHNSFCVHSKGHGAGPWMNVYWETL